MATTAAVLNIVVNASTGKASAELARLNTQMKAMDAQATKTNTAVAGKLAKGLKLVGVGAVAGAAFGMAKAVKAGASFERQMSSLGSVAEATGKQMKALEKQALDLGESSAFTAREVADAQTELAKGGLKVSQILKGGTKAALSLAAAGQLELAEAATSVVNAMKLFNIHAKDAERVADAYAVAANRTTADVLDFAMAMKQGGSAVKAAGGTFNDAVTILEALAESGIKNSDAGTSMKTALIQLSAPTKKQAALQKELNLHIFDQNGNLKKASGIAREFTRALRGKTGEERVAIAKTLAGTDGFRLLLALYDQGPKKLRALEQANQKQGTAAKVAAEKMDNLQGDWEEFTGALETAEIKIFRLVKGPLRALVQGLTTGLRAIVNFDYGGAIDGIEDIAGRVADTYQTVRDATSVNVFGKQVSLLDVLGPTPEKAKALLEGIKTVISKIPPAFEAVSSAVQDFVNGIKTGAEAVATGWNSMISGIQAGVKWIDRAASNIADFVSSLLPVKAAVFGVKNVLGPLVTMLMRVANAVIPPLLKIMGGLARAFGAVLGPAIELAAGILRSVFTAAIRVGIAMTKQIMTIIGDLAEIFGNVIGVISNLLRGKWGNAWKNAKEVVASSLGLVKDVVTTTWNVIRTTFDAGADAILSIAKTAFKTVLTAAKNLVSPLKDVFSGAWEAVENTFVAGANTVIDVINAIIKAINIIPGVPDIDPIDHIGGGGGSSKGGGARGTRGTKNHPQFRQRGGPIDLGKPSGDSVPAMLEKGEYVLNRKAVQAIGRRQLDAINFGMAPRFQKGGQVRGYALGDIVSDVGGKALGALGTAAEFSPPGLALKAGEAAADVVNKGAGYFIDKLPKPNIPEPFKGLGPYLIKQVTEWIRNGFDTKKLGKFTGLTGDLGSFPGTLRQAMQLARSFGLTITSTTGGEHAPGSYHYQGRAFDASNGVNTPQEREYFMAAASRWGKRIKELFFDPIGWYIKNGQVVRGAIGGHSDHVHTAMQRGGLIGALFQGMESGGSVVKKVGSILLRNALDLESSAGILGNAYQESGWNTEAIEPGTHNGGLWGFTASPVSLSDLKAYASKQGKPWGSAEVQTQFMLHHLPSSARSTMNKMSSINDTTLWFMNNWERPNPTYANPSRRIEGAKKALAMLKGAGVSGGDVGLGAGGEDIPAMWRGLKTGSLNLPRSTPKSLRTIERELVQRRREVKRYGAGVEKARKENRHDVAEAFQRNIRDLNNRIRELERARKAARVEAAKRKFNKRLSKALGRLTGMEKPIELAERGFNMQQQFVEQLVDLEPLQPELGANASPAEQEAAERKYVADLTSYIDQREAPAYADLLGKAADWRNTILRAERLAAGRWEEPNKPLGGLEGHWEDRIIALNRQIKRAEKFIKQTNQQRRKHKKGKLPKWLRQALTRSDKLREKLPMWRFEERGFRKALGEGQEQFYPGGSRIRSEPTPPRAGSGTFEEMLENVQGIHWPGQHEFLKTLPPVRRPGKFGGVIWDVQRQIEELDLRKSSAFRGLGGGSESVSGGEGGEATAEGKTAREERLEELLREANQSRLVFERQRPILESFAGFHAKGGFIPSGMWGIAGEAGPEIVHGPAQVFSNSDSAAMVGGNIHVEVHNYGDRTEVMVNGMKAVAAEVYDHKSRQAGKGAKTIGSRVAGKIL